MDNRPTVGVFTKQLDNWTSGSGHHMNEMMRHILALNTKLRFVFIHYKPSDNPLYKKADEELIIPRNPVKAAAELRKYHFDVLHFSPLTFFAPIWNTPGRKTATIHAIEQLIVPQFYGPIELAHELFLVPVYARRMKHIITVSETSKKFFIEKFKVKKDRISVCYNGMNECYKPLPEDQKTIPSNLKTLSGVPLTEKEKFIYHISRFSGRKNPWTIIRGFAEFSRRESGRNVKMVIAGTWWDNKKVLKLIEKLNIRDKVVLAGFVDEEDAVKLYNKAFIFIFPSLAEGFGMPSIEAMACGCPVITSNAFAIPEVVGDAAVILEKPQNPEALADKLELLTTDTELRNNLIARGFIQAEKYSSWDPSARIMLNMFEEQAFKSAAERNRHQEK